jgi:nitrogen fixation/metabolism regulation signal transduction histidine kinase
MAVVRIRLSSQAIQEDINLNKALLLSAGFLVSVFIMLCSWMIVRYVIVKPVKHLKDVSDAIAAGQLNVRSEINSGDEFEDLSHSFNRMLRNLVNMQDRLQHVNVDLDRKVENWPGPTWRCSSRTGSRAIFWPR